MMISTEKLIQNLKEVNPDGFQISYRIGLLNSTNAIYMRNGKIYLFRMEDNFAFKQYSGYPIIAFLEEFKNYHWLIEETIS